MNEENKTYFRNEDVSTDYDLEAILAEYTKEVPVIRDEEPATPIVVEQEPVAPVQEAPAAEETPAAAEAAEEAPAAQEAPAQAEEPEEYGEGVDEEEKELPVIAVASFDSVEDVIDEDDDVTIAPAAKAEPAEAAEEDGGNMDDTREFKLSEPVVTVVDDDFDADDYAADGIEPAAMPPEGKVMTTKEKLLTPIISFMAMLKMRFEQTKNAEDRRTVAEEETSPEMQPEKASNFYGTQRNAMRLRSSVALGLTALMVYLTLGYYTFLPLAGTLKSARVLSIELLVIELTVMLACLDIVVNAITNIVRKCFNFETIAVISAVFSAIDALLLCVMADSSIGLPFCAVSAASLTAALWSNYFTCASLSDSFKVLSMGKRLYTIHSEKGIVKNGVALIKTRGETEGFITRSEEADPTEYIYSVIAPVAVVLSVVLGIICGIANGEFKSFFHCISIFISMSAVVTGALCFTMPLAVTTAKLTQNGAAVAGWGGVRDIGQSNYVVITDNDVFPSGTVKVGEIRVLDGASAEKIISYTGSLIGYSGSSLAPAFGDVIRKYGYPVNRVENFEPHDGGGISGAINGETVCVGTAAYMNLIGVRMPRKLMTKNSIYSAINGTLVAMFIIEYTPMNSVQEALDVLVTSHREPIFAIRDFNVSPTLVKQKFRLESTPYGFPAYSKRYQISEAKPGEDKHIAAIVSRDGMESMVEAADKGKKLYNFSTIGLYVALGGTVFGILLMLVLCWSASFGIANAAIAILYMILLLIPTIVFTMRLQR